jgi:hypothetical protein
MNEAPTMMTGPCHVPRYLRNDPSIVVTRRLELGRAPEGYQTLERKHYKCVKVVPKP